VQRLKAWWARACEWMDRWIWNGAVQTVKYTVLGLAKLDDFVDTNVVNGGFDEGCQTVTVGGLILSLLQGGRVQSYMRMIGAALIVLVGFMIWSAR
jgi:NADH-quinone oxidoreductase subunit L